MKLDRLLSITMYLLARDRVTASELAEAFEVSVRTVYRDLDAIDRAGIPVVSSQGVGGGYCIDGRFTIARNAFKPDELGSLVSMLKGVNAALKDGRLSRTIDKLDAVIPSTGVKTPADYVVLDFTPWDGGASIEGKLSMLRRGIETCRLVSFRYLNLKGEDIRRRVEPSLLVLKGFTWYLYGYCRLRKAFRLFKLSRISDPAFEPERFLKREIDIESRPWQTVWGNETIVRLKLRLDPKARGRVEDFFPIDCIRWNDDGSGEIEISYPEDAWMYSVILSLGSDVEVLEPPEVREAVRERAQAMADLYMKTAKSTDA